MSLFVSVLLAAAAAAPGTTPTPAPAPAPAREQRYLPSVEARFRTHLDLRPRIRKNSGGEYAPSEVAAYRAIEKRIVDQLVAMPEVNAAAGVPCASVTSWAEMGGDSWLPILGGSVSAVLPHAENGRCTKLESAGVRIFLNDLHGVLALEQGFNALPATFTGDFRPAGPGLIRGDHPTRGRVLLITRPGRTLIHPVLARDLIRTRIQEAEAVAPAATIGFDRARWMATEGRRKEKELIEAFAFMGPAEARAKAAEAVAAVADGMAAAATSSVDMAARADDAQASELARLKQQLGEARPDQQACRGPGDSIDLSPDCPATEMFWRVDPDYFDRARQGSLQLVAIETGAEEERFESQAAAAARLRIWDALDVARIQALVD